MTLSVFLHDGTPAGPGEKHGPRGPTHCGTTRVDYAYQVEQWVSDLEKDQPKVVRIECPDIGREWRRDETGRFLEVKP